MSDALGPIIARVLRTAWRHDPGTPPDEADAMRAEEALMASGAGALLWHRLRSGERTGARDGALDERAAEAFRMNTLYAATHRRELTEILERTADAGLEPVLVKGWDAARRYPDEALRPYGDFDLCISPEHEDRLRAAVRGVEAERRVDVHTARVVAGVDLEAVRDGAHPVAMPDGTDVLVPAEEEALRIFALHFLKHGGWRPLWLCDVGAAVEGRTTGFDWARAARGKRGWLVVATVALAADLLGADVRETPAEGTAAPGWMRRAVLDAWERPFPAGHRRHDDPVPSPKRPLAAAAAIRSRQADPLAGAVELGGGGPRVPAIAWSAGYAGKRAAGYLARSLGRSGR